MCECVNIIDDDDLRSGVHREPRRSESEKVSSEHFADTQRWEKNGERMGAESLITSYYNCGMQPSICEGTARGSLKQMGQSSRNHHRYRGGQPTQAGQQRSCSLGLAALPWDPGG